MEHSIGYLRQDTSAAQQRGLRWMAALGAALLMAAVPGTSQAQTPSGGPSMTACAITGSVTVTIAGVTTTQNIGCLNQAQQTAPGTTDQAVANVNVPTVLGLPNLANIQGPDSTAQYVNSPTAATLTGTTKADAVQLVNNMVNAQNLRETLTCTLPSGSTTPTCQSGSTIDSLRLGGQLQTLPNPIPQDYPLPLSGNITVNLPVLGPTTIGVTGFVVLNALRTNANKTVVEHASIHVNLSGGVTLAGVGLVNVVLSLDDYTKFLPTEY